MLLQSSNSSNSKGTLMPVPSPPSNWIHFGTHGAEADKQERTRCSIARESTNCSVRAFSYRIRLTGGKVSVVICFGSQEKLRGKLGKHSVSFSAARQIGEPYYTIHILDSWFLGKLEVNLLRGKPFLAGWYISGDDEASCQDGTNQIMDLFHFAHGAEVCRIQSNMCDSDGKYFRS